MRRRVKAVITIEAAIVLPLFILSVLSLIILGMYLHDINVTKQILILGLDKAVPVINKEYSINQDDIDYERRAKRSIINRTYDTVFEGDENRFNTVKSYIVNELEERLLICNYSNFSINKKTGKMHAKVMLASGIDKIPLLGLFLDDAQVCVSKSVIDECELNCFTDAFFSKNGEDDIIN